jgi:hypothetical protein
MGLLLPIDTGLDFFPVVTLNPGRSRLQSQKASSSVRLGGLPRLGRPLPAGSRARRHARGDRLRCRGTSRPGQGLRLSPGPPAPVG